MSECKGKSCKSANGKNHSKECIAEYEKTIGVPLCFDRAESGGRSFDNCKFFQVCKQVKPICVNNPITLN